MPINCKHVILGLSLESGKSSVKQTRDYKALINLPYSAFVEPLVILAILVANGELADDQLCWWDSCLCQYNTSISEVQ